MKRKDIAKLLLHEFITLGKPCPSGIAAEGFSMVIDDQIPFCDFEAVRVRQNALLDCEGVFGGIDCRLAILGVLLLHFFWAWRQQNYKQRDTS